MASVWIKDTKVSGLYRREFASGKASYAVRKREGARVLTVTLGDAESLSVEDARKKAVETLNKAVVVKNGHTLKDVLKVYLQGRELKSRSRETMESTLRTHFSDWLEAPIRDITRKMIEERMAAVKKNAAKNSRGRVANARGHGTQAKAARYIRSLFRVAVMEEYIEVDPTLVISGKKIVKGLKRKKSYLLPSHRKALLQAIDGPTVDSGIADLIRVLMFTGCRISEALNLRWADVDRDNRYLTFRDTKNGLDHVVAYSTELETMIARRKGKAEFLTWSDGSPIKNPYKHFAELGERLGFEFSPHDFRRTWATVADEIGVSRETVKACLNHISGRNEVTEGYVIRSPETLRSAFQTVDNALRSVYAKEVRTRTETKDSGSEGLRYVTGRNPQEVRSLSTNHLRMDEGRASTDSSTAG